MHTIKEIKHICFYLNKNRINFAIKSISICLPFLVIAKIKN